jgi:hypothetical protein
MRDGFDLHGPIGSTLGISATKPARLADNHEAMSSI